MVQCLTHRSAARKGREFPPVDPVAEIELALHDGRTGKTKLAPINVCGGYQSKGEPMPDITLQLKETEAVIYNRRTGDVVEKKLFPPDPECPMFTLQRAGDRTTDSSTPYSAIEAWARTRVKR